MNMIDRENRAAMHKATTQTGRKTGASGAMSRAQVAKLLRDADLRPTRQRIALAELLFSKGDRHLAAETLYEEAARADVGVSLATVYNTLHQFTDAGLLRAIAIDTSKTYFDTNTGDHHHFFIEADNEVIDMPDGYIRVDNLPEPPPGMEVSRVDVVVRVRRNQT